MPAALPEVVFFDLGDTLMRTHPSWAGVYRLGLAEHGIDVDEDELARALAQAPSHTWIDETPFEATEAASFARVREFDQQVLAALGYPDLPDAAFRAIEEAFMRRTSWYVFPDVLPAVEALAAASVRMGIISNWVWGGPELIHAVDLARHFEALVVSARVGFQKPAAAIFEHALELLRVAPERAVHVGDNYRADVEGARRVGIAPVLIDRRTGDPSRHADFLPPEHAGDVPVISDLFGLLDLLGIARPAEAAVR